MEPLSIATFIIAILTFYKGARDGAQLLHDDIKSHGFYEADIQDIIRGLDRAVKKLENWKKCWLVRPETALELSLSLWGPEHYHTIKLILSTIRILTDKAKKELEPFANLDKPSWKAVIPLKT